MTDTTALVEELARAIAQSHGLDFDEVCGCDADPDNGDCDSGTCIATGYEDHDPEYARACYRQSATATLPIIAREVEKARAEGFAAGMEFDPDESTGCADDALPGTAEQWKAAIRATEVTK